MLAIEPPRTGQVIHWLISEVISRESNDTPYFENWADCLESKRSDDHYPHVLESIRERGFVRPVNVYVDEDNALHLADGHHRLAAAIDLGYEIIPAVVRGFAAIALDSGQWRRGDAILPVDTDDEPGGWWVS